MLNLFKKKVLYNKMSFNCGFCNNVLSSKSSLNYHQKTNKKCLQIQGKDINKYTCIGCNKKFSYKAGYNRHISNCGSHDVIDKKIIEYKKKLNKQNKIKNRQIKDIEIKHKKELKEKDIEHKKELKEQESKYMKQICDLQDRIQELATKAIEKPTTKNNYTTNTNIMNLAPLDMEEFAKRVEEVIMNNMNENHLIEGQAGVARLLSGSGCLKTNEGKNFITCTDTSRGVWKHKDKDGNIVKDYKAGKIAKVVHPIANKKADGIVSDFTMTGNSQRRLEELERMISENKEKLESEEDYLEGFNQEDPEYDNTLRKMCKLEDDIRYWTSEMKRIKSEDSVHRYNYNEVLFKLYKGKKELVGLNDDSTNFSNKLISLV